MKIRDFINRSPVLALILSLVTVVLVNFCNSIINIFREFFGFSALQVTIFGLSFIAYLVIFRRLDKES